MYLYADFRSKIAKRYGRNCEKTHKLLEISLFQMFHVTYQNAIVIVIWYRINPRFLEIRPLHSTVKPVLNDHSKIDKQRS